ncbi:hypothetical protein [Absidia glauca]|uniref:GATA-type domain-containing protein n=1 Tax=Absidia glauca TaxID=4829 RepID=A0A168NBR5_ABSGL|nr:hypothetical protein [Absidia glauca]
MGYCETRSVDVSKAENFGWSGYKVTNKEKCRLRSFASIAKNINPCQFEDENVKYTKTWDVVDVVMYIVTECIVLAFFHTQEPYFNSEDVDLVLDVLKAHQPSSTSPNINCSSCDSQRVLQMYDQSTKRRLFSWPPSNLYYNPNGGHSMQLFPESTTPIPISSSPAQQEHFNKVSKSGTAACMQHTHTQSICIHPPSSLRNKSSPPTAVSPSSSPTSPPSPSTSPSCQVERVVISYGCILFYSYQINSTSQSSTPSATNRNDPADPATSTTYNHTSTESSSKPSFATNTQHFMSTSLSPMASHLRTSHYHQLPHPHQHMYQSPLPHPHSHSSPTSSHQPLKRCVRCGTNNSPEWRRGPTGHKTLCNACGLRYSRLMSKQQSGTKLGFRRNS